MPKFNIIKRFALAAYETAQQNGRKAIAWIKSNPLKISGFAGAVAMIALGYAGELVLNNHLMLAGSLFEALGYLVETIWGHGGPGIPSAALPTVSRLVTTPKTGTRFSLKKCLDPCGHPVQTATFLGFLGGLGFIGAGLESFAQHGGVEPGGSYLIFLGAAATIGDIYANCVPARQNHLHPMTKAAFCYGLTTLCLFGTALGTNQPSLFFAALAGGISDLAFGLSTRHENIPRRPAHIVYTAKASPRA